MLHIRRVSTSSFKESSDLRRYRPKKSRLIPSVRFFIIALVFAGNFFSNAGFTLLNFTLVCMVNSTAFSPSKLPNNSLPDPQNRSSDCNNPSSVDQSDESGYFGELLWDHNKQANVIAGYSWGMLFFTIPAGVVIQRMRATKMVFLFGAVVNAASMLVTPILVYLPSGEWFLFAARLLSGIDGGMAWPITMAAASRWVPEREFGTMIAFACSGFSLAGIFINFSSGYFCALGPAGWTYAFYFWGSLNLLLVVALLVFYKDDPSHSTIISGVELKDILANRSLGESHEDPDHPRARLPVAKMLASLAFWAIVSSNLAASWSAYFQSEFTPTYIKEVLNFDTRQNGLFAALPYILGFFGLILFGYLSDKVTVQPDESQESQDVKKASPWFRRVTPTTSVKIFEALALGGSALAFTTISFCDSNMAPLAIASLCACTLAVSSGIVGYTRSTYHIAPAFVGVVSSIGETIQGIVALIVPYIVAAVTPNQSVVEWQRAMIMAAVICFIGMLVFLAFGSGEEQSWAKIGRDQPRRVGSAASESEKVVHDNWDVPTLKLRF